MLLRLGKIGDNCFSWVRKFSNKYPQVWFDLQNSCSQGICPLTTNWPFSLQTMCSIHARNDLLLVHWVNCLMLLLIAEVNWACSLSFSVILFGLVEKSNSPPRLSMTDDRLPAGWSNVCPSRQARHLSPWLPNDYTVREEGDRGAHRHTHTLRWLRLSAALP